MSFAYNLSLIEEQFLRYQKDPTRVDPTWRAFFEGVEFGEKEEASSEVRVFNLLTAYRTFGHLIAKVNPIATKEPSLPFELTLSALGFEESELSILFPTLGLLDKSEASLKEILEVLRAIYAGTVAIEYMHLPAPKLKSWLQEKIEPTRFRPRFSVEKKRAILEQLNKATLFEIFLHTKYVGQKRFSLEGGETLIPLLNEIIEQGAVHGLEEVVIGMAHRGRLNVLTNVLQKSYSMVFSEFEGFVDSTATEESGDVKYHKGFSSTVTTASGKKVHVSLSANPSHLEAVGPVVEGKVRAKQVLAGDEKKEKVIPIVIHGDASIAGQGVVYETLQLYKLKGYSTGGTIHIVVNNQIGFTTLPEYSRSTHYCTNIAEAFSAPVFHVNAEDPEGCVFAMEMALYIRQNYHCDVFIDLNCYRKHGHNEGDEPFFTQPLESNLIKNKKTIREIYLETLISEKAIDRPQAQALEEAFQKELHRELEEIKISREAFPEEAYGGRWQEYHRATLNDLFEKTVTCVSKEVLTALVKRISEVPKGFSIHPKVQKVIDDRKKMLEEGVIDWAFAEQLSFATILEENASIRLSGQDSARGTFSQRHAVWVDQKLGSKYFPLSQLKNRFEVNDSSLSEYAILGFEYGYSLADPRTLVLWEAQFGDFANGAQIIIDQFIAPGEAKWARSSGLVLLLPHGFEGQGPEHSSARMERFLQLSAAANMQVVNPTTPAQYFHLLRRQIIRKIRKPLIVFTPKGLLRHPRCVSPLQELTSGFFQEFLAEENPQATRVLLCSGRIYYDLLQQKEKRGRKDIALVRIEQLYPLIPEELKKLLSMYPQAKEFFWVQDEPRNMGAWSYMYPILLSIIPTGCELTRISRKRAASPASGSHIIHIKEHEEIMNKAFI